MTLRDLDIDIDLDIETRGLFETNNEINRLISNVERINDDIRIDVDVNNRLASTLLSELQLQADELDHDAINIDVNTHSLDALTDLATFNHYADLLDGRDIDIDVDVDTAMAHMQVATLQTHLMSLRSPNLSLPSFGGGLDANLLGLVGTGTKITSVAMALPALASGAQVAVGALGTLGVTLGVVGGGALSFASALGVGAVGIGGFSALAVSTISELYDENAKLTKAQRELKEETDSVLDSWRRLKTELEPDTFSAIESGVISVNTVLGRAEPILGNATRAVDGLFTNLNNSLQNERVTATFDYFERSIGPITTNIGNGFGYAVQGVGNFIVALEPLTNWSAQGFENMMENFADWSFDLQGSDKMIAFMDYVKAELPTVGTILGEGTTGIVNFFAAFDTTASEGLGWMAEEMQEFATWSSTLDENQGFQDMLERIKTDGPEVAEAIGNIASHISNVTAAISDSGAIELFNNLLDKDIFNYEKMGDMFSFKNFFDPLGAGLNALKSFNWGNIFSGKAPEIDVKVGADTAELEAYLMTLSKTDIIDIAVSADVGMAEQEIGRLTKREIVDLIINADTVQVEQQLNELSKNEIVELIVEADIGIVEQQLASLTKDELVNVLVTGDTAQLQASLDAVTATEKQVPMRAKVDQVDTTSLGPVKLRADLLFGQSNTPQFKFPPLPEFKFPPLPSFTWPTLPKFDWPPLPKWTWPALPVFRWPAYPVFRWPAMPTVRVSVSGGTAVQGSHSTGLGRVPHDGYIAELHQDETVLTANQADVLRDMGALQGDGAAPSLNLPTVPTGGNSGGGGPAQVSVGDIHITVQGGNTNAETGANVKAAMQEFFADLATIFPQVLEG